MLPLLAFFAPCLNNLSVLMSHQSIPWFDWIQALVARRSGLMAGSCLPDNLLVTLDCVSLIWSQKLPTPTTVPSDTLSTHCVNYHHHWFFPSSLCSWSPREHLRQFSIHFHHYNLLPEQTPLAVSSKTSCSLWDLYFFFAFFYFLFLSLLCFVVCHKCRRSQRKKPYARFSV